MSVLGLPLLLALFQFVNDHEYPEPEETISKRTILYGFVMVASALMLWRFYSSAFCIIYSELGATPLTNLLFLFTWVMLAIILVILLATVAEFGGIDVLVNNAGVTFHNAVEDKPVSEFQKTIDINLTGAYRCSKYAGEVMKDGDGGVILNVSSMSAFIANYPQQQVDYQASKGALEAFKNQLASEWAADGIRVNNINPGYVFTDNIVHGEETIETWRSEMLVEEFAAPEDIAPLVVYLASDAAWYVTGESVVIDGGYTVR